MGKAVVLVADTPFGRALCADFLRQGWSVFGGTSEDSPSPLDQLQATYPATFHPLLMNPQSTPSLETAATSVAAMTDRVDLLIANADHPYHDTFTEGLDFDALQSVYDINAIGPIRFVEAFLPLTAQGLKRLCFITDARGCIGLSTPEENVGYSISKTALHMAVTIMSNHLRKDGYTFRLFLPGNPPEESAASASAYFRTNRDDEFRLTITDATGAEWPL